MPQQLAVCLQRAQRSVQALVREWRHCVGRAQASWTVQAFGAGVVGAVGVGVGAAVGAEVGVACACLAMEVASTIEHG